MDTTTSPYTTEIDEMVDSDEINLDEAGFMIGFISALD